MIGLLTLISKLSCRNGDFFNSYKQVKPNPNDLKESGSHPRLLAKSLAMMHV